MCELQYLASAGSNYIALCKSCLCYQVCFGNVLISINKESFKSIQKTIKKIQAIETDYPDANLRKYLISTLFSGVNLFLTMAEVQQLGQMMEEAENEEVALSIFKLFE